MNKSPFPGMDPYLEGEMWPEFHDTLIHQIRAQLMPRLQPKYVALLQKYYVVDELGLGVGSAPVKRGIYPDVNVARIKEAIAGYETITAAAVELISPIPQKMSVLRLDIRDVANRRLVTAIEILSPVNKRGPGFRKYLKKRGALLKTKTHLLEIDLLRAGERIPLIGGELPPAPYYVFLSRFTRRPTTEVWPVALRERLPTVPVPLLPPDPDVPLSLQATIDACFELVGYQNLLDYRQPPLPPLGQEDLDWVRLVVSSISKSEH
ncbi:MAG: DUF4058 family protein [Anaerolineae bacterium]|nr:DUF4058 family protein [Anaerolineae bacterium]